MIIYRAVWRFYALWIVFFIPVVALCIPACIDGFAVRARKKYTFESNNRIYFYTSMQTLMLMLGLLCFLPLAPIPLTSSLLVAMILGMVFTVWTTTSNLQTGT